MKRLCSDLALAAVAAACLAAPAFAQTVTYESPLHVFSIDDVLGGLDGVYYAQDASIICTDAICPGEQPYEVDGTMLFPIDAAFTYDPIDFVGAFERDRDGIYEEGWAGNLLDAAGASVIGVLAANVDTETLKSEGTAGTWCAGLGGISVKCSTEHFTVMEHILTCDETVPYFYYDPATGLPSDPDFAQCGELEVIPDGVIAALPPNENSVIDDIAVGVDYSVTLKDDGKPLYRWGTLVKRPTDIRLYARIPLPAEWTEPGAEFTVTRAELTIRHRITNNPNDQVRPEDFENEAATGRLPSYVVSPGGYWLSTVDCFESDGDFIPAGTVLKNPNFSRPEALSEDLREGYTNAWYTTLNRDPFEIDPTSGSGPRWRLKAGKFGQDVPGLEIPIIECSQPPYTSANIKYPVGEETTTVLDLLDWEEGEVSPLASSLGWRAYQDGDDGAVDGLSPNGLPLTDDFDLAVYIKGDKKPAVIYDAQLSIDYLPADAAQAAGEGL